MNLFRKHWALQTPSRVAPILAVVQDFRLISELNVLAADQSTALDVIPSLEILRRMDLKDTEVALVDLDLVKEEDEDRLLKVLKGKLRGRPLVLTGTYPTYGAPLPAWVDAYVPKSAGAAAALEALQAGRARAREGVLGEFFEAAFGPLDSPERLTDIWW